MSEAIPTKGIRDSKMARRLAEGIVMDFTSEPANIFDQKITPQGNLKFVAVWRASTASVLFRFRSLLVSMSSF